MHIWLPTIKAVTGADVFAGRLADGLAGRNVPAELTWFNRYYELCPPLLLCAGPPEHTDIITANSWYGYGFKRKGIKLVITVYHCVHDEAYAAFRSMLQKIYHNTSVYINEYCSLRAADKVVAISRYTAASVKRVFSGQEPVVIHPGIDTVFFRPGPRGRSNDVFRLLFVGIPSRRKGFDLLAPIMRQLGAGYSLSYTGNAHEPPPLENMKCLGRVSNDALLQAYQDCDALLFPTRLEGFGYAVCEAMACGKPVITSDNSSLPELVKRNETGLLCRTDDVDAFVQAVKILANDRDLAVRMGEAGRECVQQNFTLEKMTDDYIRLYKEVLSS